MGWGTGLSDQIQLGGGRGRDPSEAHGRDHLQPAPTLTASALGLGLNPAKEERMPPRPLPILRRRVRRQRTANYFDHHLTTCRDQCTGEGCQSEREQRFGPLLPLASHNF